MNKYDLSVLIPARNEQFLAQTVENVLENIEGNTEIIVVLDGQWADPPITIDPLGRVTILFVPEAIGQRAATNQACRLSNAKYVMKLDAHCALDKGFDVKMIAEMKDNYTMIPTMYNLHAFDWVCNKCENRWYQGPTPVWCHLNGNEKERNPNCDSTSFRKDIIWKPRFSKKSNYYRFDKTLHFQYWGAFEKRPGVKENDVVPIMSAQGSCFMLTREKYWELDICDERSAGKSGWGQQGVEVALKTQLSGGVLVVNKKTWYSHMFRTQGGDFGFPYPISGSEQEFARSFSRDLWLNNKWPLAKMTFEQFLEKWYPIPDWHDERQATEKSVPSKGIIFYTDNKVNVKMAHAVQKQLKSIGLPIVSSSLKPMAFGENVHLPLERGYLTMFKQILAALEASTADIIYMCEHDVLYHPSHFDFTPPDENTFYYNINVWKVDAKTGHALKVDVCQQVSGLVAYRKLLIKEYKNRINRLERVGKFERSWGFEPGTKSIKRGGFSDIVAVNFESAYPNIDIRGDHNLTANRWRKDQFRNQENTRGWTESNITEINGWSFPIKEEFYKYL